MTDNGKAIQLKLQAAKRNADAVGHKPPTKVFLGNFTYAEFIPGCVRLTDEDGCGRAMDTILLTREQLYKLEDFEAKQREGVPNVALTNGATKR